MRQLRGRTFGRRGGPGTDDEIAQVSEVEQPYTRQRRRGVGAEAGASTGAEAVGGRAQTGRRCGGAGAVG